jgi:hypothetical protein
MVIRVIRSAFVLHSAKFFPLMVNTVCIFFAAGPSPPNEGKNLVLLKKKDNMSE